MELEKIYNLKSVSELLLLRHKKKRHQDDENIFLQLLWLSHVDLVFDLGIYQASDRFRKQ